MKTPIVLTFLGIAAIGLTALPGAAAFKIPALGVEGCGGEFACGGSYTDASYDDNTATAQNYNSQYSGGQCSNNTVILNPVVGDDNQVCSGGNNVNTANATACVGGDCQGDVTVRDGVSRLRPIEISTDDLRTHLPGPPRPDAGSDQMFRDHVLW